MANKIPEDVAYTITTGYYPEIASKIKYKNKKGKGGTGKKFVRKRGFTDVSIEKERVRKSRDTNLTGLAGGASSASAWADSITHSYVDNPCLTSSVSIMTSYNTSLADSERSAGQVDGDLA